jgi:hypothetical protein
MTFSLTGRVLTPSTMRVAARLRRSNRWSARVVGEFDCEEERFHYLQQDFFVVRWGVASDQVVQSVAKVSLMYPALRLEATNDSLVVSPRPPHIDRKLST